MPVVCRLPVLAYEVTNTTDRPLEVAVCGSMRNFIGKDGSKFRTDWKGDFIPVGAKRIETGFVKRTFARPLPVFGRSG